MTRSGTTERDMGRHDIFPADRLPRGTDPGRLFRRIAMWLGSFGLVVLATSLAASMDDDRPAKPSQYAPAEPLGKYIDRVVSRMEEDFEEPEEYEDEQKERVTMRANALLAIAMVLGNHDQSHSLKPHARAIADLAESLASDADDYKAARQTFQRLQELVDEPPKGKQAEGIDWEARADIAELMKAVPIVNDYLRRGVTSRRFKRTAKRTVMYAAALAAIAQVSSIDDNYCDDEASQAKWKKLCFEMRDAAAETGRALEAGDQAKAELAIKRIAKTCDACHEDFR